MDLATLPAHEAASLKKQLEKHLATSKTAAMRSVNTDSTRDGMEYEISLEDSGIRHTLKWDTGSIPDDLKPLIKMLRQQSKPQALE